MTQQFSTCSELPPCSEIPAFPLLSCGSQVWLDAAGIKVLLKNLSTCWLECSHWVFSAAVYPCLLDQIHVSYHMRKMYHQSLSATRIGSTGENRTGLRYLKLTFARFVQSFHLSPALTTLLAHKLRVYKR